MKFLGRRAQRSLISHTRNEPNPASGQTELDLGDTLEQETEKLFKELEPVLQPYLDKKQPVFLMWLDPRAEDIVSGTYWLFRRIPRYKPSEFHHGPASSVYSGSFANYAVVGVDYANRGPNSSQFSRYSSLAFAKGANDAIYVSCRDFNVETIQNTRIDGR